MTILRQTPAPMVGSAEPGRAPAPRTSTLLAVLVVLTAGAGAI